MQKEKLAIVTSGGGMRCAYSAGALLALAEKIGVRTPAIFVSASGSVGTMFYYLAGQYAAIRAAWMRDLPSKDFIRYVPRPYIDIDFLVDTVFRKRHPLDMNRLAQNSARWSVPVADVDLGELRFVTSDFWLDPYEVMRAADSIPFVYGGITRLGLARAIDGGILADEEDLVAEALSSGATRILHISNADSLSAIERGIIRLRGFFSSRAYRRILDRHLSPERALAVPEGVQLLTISPAELLPAGRITRDRRKICETFERGYGDLLAKRQEIERLLL